MRRACRLMRGSGRLGSALCARRTFRNSLRAFSSTDFSNPSTSASHALIASWSLRRGHVRTGDRFRLYLAVGRSVSEGRLSCEEGAEVRRECPLPSNATTFYPLLPSIFRNPLTVLGSGYHTPWPARSPEPLASRTPISARSAARTAAALTSRARELARRRSR